jgi:hypothetical protein
MRQAAFREMFYKRHKPSPKFSVPTIMRIYFHNNPINAVLMFMMVGAVYFGYGIYIFERETNAETFTFAGSLFLSLECMLTGYPADAYEVFMPEYAMSWGRAGSHAHYRRAGCCMVSPAAPGLVVG